MNASISQHGRAGRWTGLFLSAVIGVAVVGFFVGINDGVPKEDGDRSEQTALMRHTERVEAVMEASSLVPATHYSEMRRSQTGPTSRQQPKIRPFPVAQYDPSLNIEPSEEAKRQSLQTRASRRAYNGAPPVIPHSVQRTDDAACYACHGQGARIGDLVANQMSHEFLANCTQCHAPPPPEPFDDQDISVDNSFVGVAAPIQGERAYSGAPPTIPHSTWMRENCTACHGLDGWQGMESTHPWRTNCKQCHAPSAELDQAITSNPAPMLPPMKVKER